MKGLDLARAYYDAHGATMIADGFGAYAGRIAVGLAGDGSECMGYDDEISQDHDFGAGFCMWLTDGDYAAIGCDLNAAFEKLPSPFLGYERRRMESGGVQRVGALRMSDFFAMRIGSPCLPKSNGQWLGLSETALASATNGEVFRDDLGEFSSIRNSLLAFFPEDVRLKKLAARIGRMAQAGQYNYARCLRRNERVAALSALTEFAGAAMSATYLLNRRYMPFYKWAHRGLAELPKAACMHGLLSRLEAVHARDSAAAGDLIEEISAVVVSEMKAQGLTESRSDFLLDHCAHVMARIEDPALRGMDVFAG